MSDSDELLNSVLTEGRFKTRLLELTEAAERNEAAIEKDQGLINAIRKEQAEINIARGDLKMREDKLLADTAALASTIATHNAERERWVAQRMAVDKAQAEREAQQKTVTDAQAATDAAHRRTAQDLAQRTAAVAAGEAKHKAVVGHARALLETLGPL
jgi:hypothetical protein